MKVRAESLLGRLIAAASPKHRWLRISLPPQLARFVIAAGAQPAPAPDAMITDAGDWAAAEERDGWLPLDQSAGRGRRQPGGDAEPHRSGREQRYLDELRTGVTRSWEVRDVVHDVVAEVAPEELPVVAGLIAFDDDARVVRLLTRMSERREPLGFGLGELAAMVAPVVWLVLDETGRRPAGTAADEIAKGVKGLLRKVFRRHPKRVTIRPLTREQLGEVHQRVLEVAAQRGLPEKRAMAMADAVVARLALPAPDGPAKGPDGKAGETASSPGHVP